MPPVAFRIQVSKSQFKLNPMLNARDCARDLSRDKFKASARRFVIKQDSVAAEHAVLLAVIHREMESCDLADSIRAPGVEWSALTLWRRSPPAEHFTRSCKVKAAGRL